MATDRMTVYYVKAGVAQQRTMEIVWDGSHANDDKSTPLSRANLISGDYGVTISTIKVSGATTIKNCSETQKVTLVQPPIP